MTTPDRALAPLPGQGALGREVNASACPVSTSLAHSGCEEPLTAALDAFESLELGLTNGHK